MTGENDGCGSGGGTRLRTGLREALRAVSRTSRGVGSSPLNLRLSFVAASTNASKPSNPPGLPRAPNDATGDLAGSALSNEATEDDLGLVWSTSD